MIVLREKVSRSRIAARLVNMQPCLVGIEAGMATHYMARELVALGHVVKQVPPAFAKPFRQGHKNDFRDAHAVAEAVQRPSTRWVPIKTDDQLDLQVLHRVRSRLIGDRTAVINQLRGFLLEHGLLYAKDIASCDSSCHGSWPPAPMCCRPAWSESLETSSRIGHISMSGSRG